MSPQLFCYVALCLLGAGPLEAAVSQTPKYLVTQKGNSKSLKCEQNLGHDSMYWYKQDSKQLLKIMFAYNNENIILNETVPRCFIPDSPNKAHLNLRINSLELDDSAMYFYASSLDTALQSHLLPVYKHPGLARKMWGPCIHWDPVNPLTRVSIYRTACQYAQWSSSTFYVHKRRTEFYLTARARVHNKFNEAFRTP